MTSEKLHDKAESIEFRYKEVRLEHLDNARNIQLVDMSSAYFLAAGTVVWHVLFQVHNIVNARKLLFTISSSRKCAEV